MTAAITFSRPNVLHFFQAGFFKMVGDKKIVVVLPAYNAELTLEKTYREIPFDIVDEVVLVDDGSSDQTFKKLELQAKQADKRDSR